MNKIILNIPAECSDMRIDKYLAAELDGFSRTFIQKCLKSESVFVNDKTVKPNYNLREGDHIEIRIPEKQELLIEAENIPLDILYEDDYILVINKPKDMVVHPAAGHYSGTLVNALLYHCRDSLSGINGVLRPGIVHRIDKDTTGALAVCKTDKAHRSLAAQLAVHGINRRYRAIVHGELKESSYVIEKTIGRHPVDRKKMAASVKNGKHAVTEAKVLEVLNGYTYIECSLKTGRTHQIRVHMASIGHPVLGDTVYGYKNPPVKDLQGQTLHAYTLGFIHPEENRYMEFTAPIPEYFNQLLKKLGYKP